MKAIKIISLATLSVLFAIATPALARQEQHGEKQAHAGQPQNQHEQATHSQHVQPQQHARHQSAQHSDHQQSQHAQPQQHAQRQPQPSQHRSSSQHAQHRGNEHSRPTSQQRRVQQSAWRQHGSQNWETEHRTWQQRGGYHGYRIPDDRFRGRFGPDHGFRVYGLPFLVVGGYPRFRYGGYWLSTVDPWPLYWGNNWYDQDEVYVNFVDNGYYLYNRRYPGVGVAINISL